MILQHPLDWPAGWPRTPAHDRGDGSQFKEGGGTGAGILKRRVSLDTARKKLGHELALLRAEMPILSMNRVTRLDDRSPGVALYFRMNGRDMAMACDRFDNRAANTRSLGIAIEHMRGLERHGGGAMVERAFAGFAALPPPRTCWQILEIQPGASQDEIRKAFKDRASQSGAGGNVDMGELVKARDAALKGATA